MKLTPLPSESIIEHEARVISSKYADLIKYAKQKRSPNLNRLLALVNDVPRSVEKNWYLRITAPLIWPFHTSTVKQPANRILLAGLAIAGAISCFSLAVAVLLTFSNSPAPSNQPGTLSPIVNTLAIVTGLLFIGLAGAVFWRVIVRPWVGKSPQKPIYFAAAYVLLPGSFWIYAFQALQKQGLSWPNFSVVYSQGSLISVIATIATLLALVIPFFISGILADAVVWIWLSIVSGTDYLGFIHSPIATDLVRALATEQITNSTNNDAPWRLFELSTGQLETVRRWAEANQNTSATRLLPTTIILAVLQIISGKILWPFPDDFLTSYIKNTFGPLTDALFFTTLVQSIALGAWIGLAMGIAFVIVNLIDNQLTQNLIVEACIVAEHSKAKDIKPPPAPPPSIQPKQLSKPRGCVFGLLEILFGPISPK